MGSRHHALVVPEIRFADHQYQFCWKRVGPCPTRHTPRAARGVAAEN